MNNRISLDGEWKLAFGERSTFDESMTVIPAEVPGNFELDLERAGIIDEIFYGTNILKIQDYETTHMFYFRDFNYAPDEQFTDMLCFEGIDCFAEIFIDEQKVGECSNMLVEHTFPLPALCGGVHKIMVHITPAVSAAREIELPPYVHAMKYSWDSLYVRKAPHMYGWDIMPRAVSGGIWKHVYIGRCKKSRISDVFAYTKAINGNSAEMIFKYNTKIEYGNIRDFSLKISGVSGESRFAVTSSSLWHTSGEMRCRIENPKLWYPRNYGEPNLYEITAELYYKNEPADSITFKTGIRIIDLNRTSTTDKNGNGEFCFIVNGMKIFAMGTNWVPVDAFHSRDEKRLPEILPMLDDLGCNMVRCWGGNVYENDIFYTYCDEHGILVWQDFAMACAVYPQDEWFQRALRDEIEKVVKRLRNHPSLALWAGDNECDQAYYWSGADKNGKMRDPNQNSLTRKVIPEVLRSCDLTRPYLPSSPYIDEYAYESGMPISEDHLWGPRDYFKGDYYRNTMCHFASETGYHGCPSPESLKKFIPEKSLWTSPRETSPRGTFPENTWLTDKNWLVHSASPELEENGAPFAYRIRLMYDQVKTLFGEAPGDPEEFSLASQISQAEAKKYFIERFRISKWRRTGIIWWNLIDGWPQISDAIVDYYGNRKLAYHYIKKSQSPFCMMFDEPQNNILKLYAVNDTRDVKKIEYKVRDDKQNIIYKGEFKIKPDVSFSVMSMPENKNASKFYHIEWTDAETETENTGSNHYVTNIKGIDFDYYKSQLKFI